MTNCPRRGFEAITDYRRHLTTRLAVGLVKPPAEEGLPDGTFLFSPIYGPISRRSYLGLRESGPCTAPDL